MRIAIIGYGGVGKAFVQLLADKKDYLRLKPIDIQLNYVIGRHGGIYDPEGIKCNALAEFSKNQRDITEFIPGGSKEVNFDLMLRNGDIDAIIEMTPTNKETGEPGMSHITRALENKVHVITSNKGPILLAYKKLNNIAIKNNVQLAIGCTTGGALPSINGGIIDLAGSEITSIEGVLNGTTNFIINEMEETACTYSEGLMKAQQLGIAETDPTLDVEGWDTASKLLILTNVLMNEEKTLENITVEGITNLKARDVADALKDDKKYKLIGKTIKTACGIEMSVKLEKLGKEHPLYGVDAKNKAVRYVSDTLGELTIIGGASGVTPAAASILRDLININRGYRYSN
ncbi:MAG: homoserine dehydrogenase [Lutispora sp.]|nr:homoserine dehydrogenase [Lutispora sp.]